ncbi:MAG TPA: FAD-dependent monooxygenase [Pseudolabrys sp.]|nr:FAD-dependent monooxygenase [Pseudolabrys sp.]
MIGKMAHLGRHAIVIGASMSGLLAGRALADYYDEVTLVDRDALPLAYEPRKGVPQGRHTHGLLARGREVLEQLFPGFTAEMVAEGAVSGDVADAVLWFNHGFYLRNVHSDLSGLAISRPMLECGVRRRLLQFPNVRIRERCDVLELMHDRDRNRVTGFQVAPREGSERVEMISSDLVVDASGRGSRSPSWLGAMGYAKPREEQIKVNIGYKTRLYRRRPEHLHGKMGAIIAACRPDWRFGAVLAQEGERWTVSLAGYFGDEVPADDFGYIEFARSLPKPEIFDIIKDAEPLGPILPYQFSTNQRRYYEELARFPEGFVVCGDALCSFNPVYGQGMTVACTEALTLRECLTKGSEGIGRRFFRAAGRLINIPWQIAVGSDLQHERVVGERTVQVRFVNWYIERLFRSANRDSVLATKFLEVANLMRTPSTLLSPAVALRVWKGQLLP